MDKSAKRPPLVETKSADFGNSSTHESSTLGTGDIGLDGKSDSIGDGDQQDPLTT